MSKADKVFDLCSKLSRPNPLRDDRRQPGGSGQHPKSRAFRSTPYSRDGSRRLNDTFPIGLERKHHNFYIKQKTNFVDTKNLSDVINAKRLEKTAGHPSGASQPSGTQRKCIVWVIGHSYVYWAEQRSRLHAFGLDDSQVDIHWIGIRGATWERLRPLIEDNMHQCGPPDILVVHAGGNDLHNVPKETLIHQIKNDFSRFSELFPSLVLVWSEIVPRVSWRGPSSQEATSHARIVVNRTISNFVRETCGVVVRHRLLEGDTSYIGQDGVHLTNVGLDIFNNGLRVGIEKALFLWRSKQI